MTDVMTPTEMIWMLTQQLADANAEVNTLREDRDAWKASAEVLMHRLADAPSRNEAP